MKFYLGSHMVNWLSTSEIPLFVSHQRLKKRKKLPRAFTGWALDSGGFTELSKNGRWSISKDDYIAAVRRYQKEIGNLDWAAIQDHMCEPFILKKTGRTISQHQQSTVQSFLDLKSAAPEIPWAPVIQGFEQSDYLRCVELYEAAGVDLRKEPIVGVGSICRRQQTTEAVFILRSLAALGIKLHGFGFKSLGLQRVSSLLVSSDSMAWSFNARKNPTLPGHTHKSCANCFQFAQLWRQNLLSTLERQQQNESLQMSLW
jgi:hypothetical protein